VGVEVGEGDGLLVGLVRGFVFVFVGLAPVVHEDFGEAAEAVGGVVDVFGGWRQGAEVGVLDDLFDLDRCGVGFLLFGEVERGDLEGVEEQAGAARGEGAGGELFDDGADGELDGGTVFGHGEGEGLRVVGFGFAGWAVGLVEVAEGLVVEAGGFAAADFGEDVAALEAFFGGRHMSLPSPYMSHIKWLKRKEIAPWPYGGDMTWRYLVDKSENPLGGAGRLL
jgi:hypothetical protein